MSVERLRAAAALMRERADVWDYHASPWRVEPGPAGWSVVRSAGVIEDDFAEPSAVVEHDTFVFQMDTTSTARHIASWHPAVALAVADWLEATAVRCDMARERGNHSWRGSRQALAVADAYLGSAS